MKRSTVYVYPLLKLVELGSWEAVGREMRSRVAEDLEVDLSEVWVYHIYAKELDVVTQSLMIVVEYTLAEN